VSAAAPAFAHRSKGYFEAHQLFTANPFTSGRKRIREQVERCATNTIGCPLAGIGPFAAIQTGSDDTVSAAPDDHALVRVLTHCRMAERPGKRNVPSSVPSAMHRMSALQAEEKPRLTWVPDSTVRVEQMMGDCDYAAEVPHAGIQLGSSARP